MDLDEEDGRSRGGSDDGMEIDEGNEDDRPILAMNENDRESCLLQIAIRHCHYEDAEREFRSSDAPDELSQGSEMLFQAYFRLNSRDSTFVFPCGDSYVSLIVS